MTAEAFRIVEDDELTPARGDLDLAKRYVAAAALVGDQQHRARHRVLAFCDANPDALYRSCLAGHLTGSAAVVDARAGRTLLIHHAKLDRWLQPGGHADGDGNLGAVALREANEETGLVGLRLVVPAIDVDIHRIPARRDEPAHDHLDLRFVVLAGETIEAAPNHETLGAGWSTTDAPEITESAELTRMIGRAVAVASRL